MSELSKALRFLLITAIIVIPLVSGENFENMEENCNKEKSIFLNRQAMKSVEVEWYRTYGSSQTDWGWAVQQTFDGGYIIAGETTSYGAGSYDAWLVKVDENGREEWNRTFGGQMRDGARSVQQTAEGGYILAGYADSYGFPGHDAWLIKTDENGNEQWNQTVGGRYSDAGYNVKQTNDGGYIVTGYTYSYGSGSNDLWIIKTDNDGVVQWTSTVGGYDSDYGHAIQELEDGGFVTTGVTSSFGSGNQDVLLVKTDHQGNVLWQKTYGGSENDWSGSIQLTIDGGFVVVGDTHSYGSGGYDLWLIKTNKNGSKEWDCIVGKQNSDETGYAGLQTYSGSFIAAGISASTSNGLGDVWLVKINGDGNIDWNMSFGGRQRDGGYALYQCREGGYIVGGYTESYGNGGRDMLLVKILDREENPPPRKPTITGPVEGKVGENYTYSGHAVDPDGDQLYYLFDWGDGTDNDWLGPYFSGEEVSASHIWDSRGNYDIKVKAKDTDGAQSEWSDPLPVSMPYEHQTFWELIIGWILKLF
jgi:hypothetical protein